MANEFVVNGLFLYRQYDEQVYIWHPNSQDFVVKGDEISEKCSEHYSYLISRFIYDLALLDHNIIYLLNQQLYRFTLDSGITNFYIVGDLEGFYIPYPLPDPTLEAERQAILNEYILTNNI